MTTARMDMGYGPYTGHQADPRNDPEEGLLSQQDLGDATVMVEYDLGVYGLPTIVGCWIAGEFVEEAEFSQRRLSAWTAAISEEIRKDREDDIANALADLQEMCE